MTYSHVRWISLSLIATAIATAAGCGKVESPPADVDAGVAADVDAAAAPEIDAAPPPVAPETRITAGPQGSVASRDATIEFTADLPGSTFECQIDHDAPGACSSPIELGVTSDGAHTFAVTASHDGVADPTAATVTWQVDTGAPAIAITSGPLDPTHEVTATFVFSADADATVRCLLDGAVLGTCTSPRSLAALAPNTRHTFEVQAADAAGNTSALAYGWTIDTLAPVVTITAGPKSPTTSTSALFAFTTEPQATVACSLDGAKATPCKSATSMTYVNLFLGKHLFTVFSLDHAGNVGSAKLAWLIQ